VGDDGISGDSVALLCDAGRLLLTRRPLLAPRSRECELRMSVKAAVAMVLYGLLLMLDCRCQQKKRFRVRLRAGVPHSAKRV
jgi:hypothetical protein